MTNVTVRFDADIILTDDDIPDLLTYASLQQAVQDIIGTAGAVVTEVTEWEAT